MFTKRGEIATILTLGVLAVIGITTIASTLFLNSGKKIDSNSRASELVTNTVLSDCEATKLKVPDNWVLNCKVTCDSRTDPSLKTRAVSAGVDFTAKDADAKYAGWINGYCKQILNSSTNGWCFGGAETNYCMEYVDQAKAGNRPGLQTQPTTPPATNPPSTTQPGQTTNTCADNGNGKITPGNGTTWKAVCDGGACTSNDDCAGRLLPLNTQRDSQGKAQAWCYGFTSGSRCMYLVNGQSTSSPPAQAQPTPSKQPQTTVPTMTPKPGSPVSNNTSGPPYTCQNESAEAYNSVPKGWWRSGSCGYPCGQEVNGYNQDYADCKNSGDIGKCYNQICQKRLNATNPTWCYGFANGGYCLECTDASCGAKTGSSQPAFTPMPSSPASNPGGQQAASTPAPVQNNGAAPTSTPMKFSIQIKNNTNQTLLDIKIVNTIKDREYDVRKVGFGSLYPGAAPVIEDNFHTSLSPPAFTLYFQILGVSSYYWIPSNVFTLQGTTFIYTIENKDILRPTCSPGSC